jgi:putative glutamine amidotransferase
MPIRIGVSFVQDPTSGSGANYFRALRAAGAEPVALATAETCPTWPAEAQFRALFDPDSALARELVGRLAELDGLLLTGGGDIDPMLYREACDGSQPAHWPRDHVEMGQFRVAQEHGLPILGICRGFQFVNVALGGSLVQDLPAADVHRDATGRPRPCGHLIGVARDSVLATIVAAGPEGDPVVGVNSYHHQGVVPERLAPGLVPTATWQTRPGEPTELIEAVETAATRAGQEFVLAVQWHPERGDDPAPRGPGQHRSFGEASRRLFQTFVAAAERRRSGG